MGLGREMAVGRSGTGAVGPDLPFNRINLAGEQRTAAGAEAGASQEAIAKALEEDGAQTRRDVEGGGSALQCIWGQEGQTAALGVIERARGFWPCHCPAPGYLGACSRDSKLLGEGHLQVSTRWGRGLPVTAAPGRLGAL